jgi:hypothetical protein
MSQAERALEEAEELVSLPDELEAEVVSNPERG